MWESISRGETGGGGELDSGTGICLAHGTQVRPLASYVAPRALSGVVPKHRVRNKPEHHRVEPKDRNKNQGGRIEAAGGLREGRTVLSGVSKHTQCSGGWTWWATPRRKLQGQNHEAGCSAGHCSRVCAPLGRPNPQPNGRPGKRSHHMRRDNQEGELWEAEMPVQTGQRSWGRGGLEHTGQDAPRQHCGLSTSLWFRPQWTCFPRRRHGVLRRIGFPT